ncbi:MAG: prolipoprotein diacylglyceryl transferase [Pirellulaceae bacterium]
MEHVFLPTNPLTSLLVGAGIIVSVWYWSKRGKVSTDGLPIAMGAIFGGFLGAKVGYFVAEAPLLWSDPQFWFKMLIGKTILGALMVGWLGVELAKWAQGETGHLGDDFARIIPLGIGIGRVGCMVHGCCGGIAVADLPEHSPIVSLMNSMRLASWPAPAVEIGFQLAFLAFSFSLRDNKHLLGQHFHLYLITYGLFRFGHEFFRSTPRYPGSVFSPYMILALVCVIAGAIAFVFRDRGKRWAHATARQNTFET